MNVTASNGGDYTCNITNNAGYDSKTVTIYSNLNQPTYLTQAVIHFALYNIPYYG